MVTQVQEEKAVKIIYNNDMAVIDFLADLKDRGPLLQLDKFVKYGNAKPNCILANCNEDDIVILVLYKDPFELNEKSNNLTLFAHPSLRRLCQYFKTWAESGNFEETEQIEAIENILHLLYYEWAMQQDEDVQSDFLG